MVDMIEKNRLLHRYPGEDREDGIEEGLGLITIAIIGNHGENEKEDNKDKKGNSLFHIHYLYGIDFKSVKKKSEF
jgi:hypothetical protein